MDELSDQRTMKWNSPFPGIEEGPYPPLYEFVSQNWANFRAKTAIIDGHTGMQRSFDDYHSISASVAGSFASDFGISNGSTVALYSPNHVDYAPIVLGTSLCGAKVTPVNPAYTMSELDKVLERSRSSVLVAHKSTLDTALQSAKTSSFIKHVVVITDNGEGAPEGTTKLDDLRSCISAIDKTDASVTNETPVSLPYSSGTTGLPKGVSLSHSNLVTNMLQLDQTDKDVFLPQHKLISPLPFFHIYAFTVSLLYPAWKGQTVITSSGRFDLEAYCGLVQEHRPERSHLVPPILLGLAQHPIVDQYDLSSLQCIMSAAAPLSVTMADKVTDRIGGAVVKEGWGMSELSPLGTISHDANIRKGSVGPMAASTLGKVIDEEGNSLPPNEPGELVIKGPQVMMGYMDEPEKTAECLSSTGWLRTGDIAMFDEEGFCFITDRIKELIKVRGFQVAPAELEALLLKHEAIQDVAVIGVPDDKSGELPRAYIVLKKEGAIAEDEVSEWMHPQVAPYKRLHGGIVFVNEIPKSASGKILRRILRDKVKEEAATQ